MWGSQIDNSSSFLFIIDKQTSFNFRETVDVSILISGDKLFSEAAYD